MKIAACPFPVSPVSAFAAFADQVCGIVQAAAGQEARLLLLPEYCTMALATMFPGPIRADLKAQLDALQAQFVPFEDMLRNLARTHRIVIAGGSFPVRDADGRFRNRCTIATPDGRLLHQDKHRMTRFEREHWGISPGTGNTIVDLGDGIRMGVAICYDSEFPLLVRERVAAGANLVCVPSCTDSLHGFHRVQVGARARALENQCYVLTAHTIGDLPESPAIDENHGNAACYGPPDRGFPADGIIAATAIDRPGLLVVDIDAALVERVRSDGQVLNHRDW